MTYFPHDVMDIVEPTEPDLLEVGPLRPAPADYAFRRSMTVIEITLATAAAIGAVLFFADVAVPPDDQLPSGLDNWVWPAIWLIGTVCVPSAIAAIALSRRASSGPLLVLLATALLGVELVVQIPFVGLSWLQLLVALSGVSAAVMAIVARGSTRTPDRASR